MRLRNLRFNAVVTVCLWLALGSVASAQQAQPYVGPITLVSSTRFGRVDFDYVYRIQLTNPGSALVNVSASVRSTSASTIIVDSEVAFGSVAAGTTLTSTDTFTLRQNRTVPFNPAALQWTIAAQPANTPPVANAGADQSVPVGLQVTLDATGSSDVDGNSLTYAWLLESAPVGSSAALDDATAVTPHFNVDRPGDYLFSLVVNDGIADSTEDLVQVSTANAGPSADAGLDLTVARNALVQLDGTGSSDPDGDALTFEWTLTDRPDGSSAALVNALTSEPLLQLDLPGVYSVSLVVDDGVLFSDPDTILISTTNSIPVADAADDQTGSVGDRISVDGSGSSDDDGDALLFAWSLLSRPSASQTTLDSADSPIASFLADEPGTYVCQLIVNDGLANGEPDTANVTIEVAPPPLDSDGDGLTNVDEVARGTDPNNPDTDGDGLTDGAEVQIHHSSPLLVDTDGDTFPDGDEVTAGTDPSLDTSTPIGTLPPDPVAVAPPVDPTTSTTVADSTEFLYTGPNPIQTGVAPDTIEPVRAAVVRGRVLGGTGAGLPAVIVTINEHPELGQTLSRPDGTFTLAVNGGGLLTINYERDGYLPAQRQVNVPWQDYALADDLELVQLDPAVTNVDLAASVDMQVAQGRPVVDDDGERQATLLFPAGVQASMTLPDGTTHPLSSLSVRATEYTVGRRGADRMPAELPPTSAYTYAVELSVDQAMAAGATTVEFSQPLPFYVNNFRGLPVGIQVPAAYYDRTKAAWIPVPDGRVLKILSVVGGSATVDYTGDNLPDDGASLGLTGAERALLAQLYQADTILWRVPVSHFTAYDLNYGVTPARGAVPPQNPPPVLLGAPIQKRCEQEKHEVRGNSIIDCQNQRLGEIIPLVGTPFSLNYISDRSPGYVANHTTLIALSGPTVPPQLRRIDLGIDIAGRRFEQQYSPAQNLVHRFEWDGNDAFGRRITGASAKVTVSYLYDAFYALPPAIAASFGSASGVPVPGDIPAPGGARLTQVQVVALGFAIRPPVALWSPSIHHAYDVAGETLYLGGGERRSGANDTYNNVIDTVAGNGIRTFSGDGGLARAASVNLPMGVALGADGSLYIAENSSNRIRRVDADGTITTVAGTGATGFSGDGGPATEARLYSPNAVALGTDGSLYIADTSNNRIRRVDSDGIISTVAGRGTFEISGEGGLATAAGLRSPITIATAADGSLYVSSASDGRVRRVGPDGIIATVAGTGRYSIQGPTGDGGPATAATFGAVRGLALAADGSLYIADGSSRTIRRVSPGGIISTFAGNGLRFSGDGGFASVAGVGEPAGLALGADGALYIACFEDRRIRRVGPDGIITTVAGTGTSGFSGDGGRATAADLARPTSIAVGGNGSLYVADAENHRIRRVTPNLPGFTGADFAIASGDGAEVYQFDATGRHLRTVNTLTGATAFAFAYDSAGELVGITDGDGNVSIIERDEVGKPRAIVSPYGQRTMLEVNSEGILTRVTNPAGESVDIGYSVGGLMTSFTSSRGYTSQYTYDPLGRFLSSMASDGSGQTLSRIDQPNGDKTVTRTTALGRQTSYDIRSQAVGGQVRTTLFPDGTRTTIGFAPNGTVNTTTPDGSVIALIDGADPRFSMASPVAVLRTLSQGALTSRTTMSRTATLAVPTNPLSLTALVETATVNGRTATSTYTAATRTHLTTSPAGRTLTAIVDEQGRPTTVRVPGIADAVMTYDARGRLMTASQGSGPDARTVTYEYGADGHVASIVDPLGRLVTFIRDPVGRVLQQDLHGGRRIRFSYDGNGNVTSLAPPGRPAHTFTHDAADRTASYTPPAALESGATTYLYDADRRPLVVTRPGNATLVHEYDSAGRLGALRIDRGSYGFDYSTTTGRLLTVTDPQGGALVYQYSGSLLIGVARSGDAAGRVDFTYDNDFRISSIRVNGASSIDRVYDADGVLASTGGLVLRRNSTNGLLERSTLGIISTSYAYNEFGEVSSVETSIPGMTLYEASYTRDRLGRISGKAEVVTGEPVEFSYLYDASGALHQVHRDGVARAFYLYDANGNRLSKTVPGFVETGTYDDQDRLLSYFGANYTYTPNGDLATKTDNGEISVYRYDVLGNLTSVTLPDGRQVDYVTDGQDRRVVKRIDGIQVQALLYQDTLKPAAEIDAAGNVLSRFVYGTRVNVPEYMIRGGATYRFVTDQLGSPRLLVDAATGEIAQRIEYDEFGAVLSDTNPGFQPFGFAGGLYDVDTKLVRFGERDFDSRIGRWLSKDPIRFSAGDSNLYRYAKNQPLQLSDPSGRASGKPLEDYEGQYGTEALLLLAREDLDLALRIWMLGEIVDTASCMRATSIDEAREIAEESFETTGPLMEHYFDLKTNVQNLEDQLRQEQFDALGLDLDALGIGSHNRSRSGDRPQAASISPLP